MAERRAQLRQVGRWGGYSRGRGHESVTKMGRVRHGEMGVSSVVRWGVSSESHLQATALATGTCRKSWSWSNRVADNLSLSWKDRRKGRGQSHGRPVQHLSGGVIIPTDSPAD